MPEALPFYPATISWMLEQGFDPLYPAQPGRYIDTPLILACRQGRADIVTDLLRWPQRIILNHRNMDGTNALWAAVVANDFTIARQLLEAGVDLENLNDNGASVLMYAASAGRTEWVKFLLDQGADIRPQTLDGFTALDLAANIEILRLLKNATRRRAEHAPEAIAFKK